MLQGRLPMQIVPVLYHAVGSVASAASRLAGFASASSTFQHMDTLHAGPQCPPWLPKRIILLRHAQSADLETSQAERRVPNHKIPLTPQGVRQAQQCALKVHQLMSAVDPDYSLFVYSSPYDRTVETVRWMLQGLAPGRVRGFQEEVQLREQDWGNFQDKQLQRLQQQERLEYGRFFYRFPAGESVADVYDRVTSFQDHLVRDLAGGRWGPNTGLVLCTHGLTLRVFLMRWLHWTMDEFLQVYNAPNAEPIVLERVPDIRTLPGYQLLCSHTPDPIPTGMETILSGPVPSHSRGPHPHPSTSPTLQQLPAGAGGAAPGGVLQGNTPSGTAATSVRAAGATGATAAGATGTTGATAAGTTGTAGGARGAVLWQPNDGNGVASRPLAGAAGGPEDPSGGSGMASRPLAGAAGGAEGTSSGNGDCDDDADAPSTNMIHTKAFYRLSKSSQQVLAGVTDDMCVTSYCRINATPRVLLQGAARPLLPHTGG